MVCEVITPGEVLEMLPQKRPFRFIDVIHELDEDHIVASYRYRADEFFYEGHFPGNPVTPGVILIETMAQTGVVALGIYLWARKVSRDDIPGVLTLFSEAEVEFHHLVKPEQRVTVHARKLFFRRGKLRVDASLRMEDGTVACTGAVAGIGVPAR